MTGGVIRLTKRVHRGHIVAQPHALLQKRKALLRVAALHYSLEELLMSRGRHVPISSNNSDTF